MCVKRMLPICPCFVKGLSLIDGETEEAAEHETGGDCRHGYVSALTELATTWIPDLGDAVVFKFGSTPGVVGPDSYRTDKTSYNNKCKSSNPFLGAYKLAVDTELTTCCGKDA